MNIQAARKKEKTVHGLAVVADFFKKKEEKPRWRFRRAAHEPHLFLDLVHIPCFV